MNQKAYQEKFYLVTISRDRKLENIYMSFFKWGEKNSIERELVNFISGEKFLGRETCVLDYSELAKIQYEVGVVGIK